MKWHWPAALAAVVILGVLGPAATAGAQSASEHSDNVSWIANWNNHADYQGSDQAYWGDRDVLGQYASPGGFQLMNIADPAHPRPEGLFDCPGAQADVSIWKDLVIVSVDSARGAGDGPDGKPRKPEECGAPGASQNENQAGTAWEGLRLVSIANPAKPVQIATVKTDCGSHTHTLVPDPEHGRLIAYVLSYPLGAPQPNCNANSHRKISIVDIPLASPQSAKVIGSLDVSPNIGCHDVTVFLRARSPAPRASASRRRGTSPTRPSRRSSPISPTPRTTSTTRRRSRGTARRWSSATSSPARRRKPAATTIRAAPAGCGSTTSPTRRTRSRRASSRSRSSRRPACAPRTSSTSSRCAASATSWSRGGTRAA